MMLAVVILWGNAFTWGYDGTLLNALQSMPQWNKEFDTPTGDILGAFKLSGEYSGDFI